MEGVGVEEEGLLSASKDVFGGVIIDETALPNDPIRFDEMLQSLFLFS